MNKDDIHDSSNFQYNFENSGWRLIWRSTKNHGVIGFEKPYHKSEAWIWMLWAAWGDENKPKELVLGGEKILQEYGTFYHSLRFMADAWGWSTSKVRRFLGALRMCSMVDLKSTHEATHVTICNFKHYQNPRHNVETTTTRDRHVTDTKRNTKEYKRNKDRTKLKNNFAPDSQFYRAGKYICERIVENHSRYSETLLSEKEFQKAASVVEKCVRLDKRSLIEIRRGVDYAFNDDFWCDKFQSPSKLRQKSRTVDQIFILIWLDQAENSNGKQDDNFAPYYKNVTGKQEYD